MLDYCHKDGGWLDTYGKDEKNAVFVAADGGEIVGFSLLLEEKSASPEFMVALRPDRLGNGLGRTVAQLTLAAGFSRQEVTHIRLIVRKNNFRAQALYASLGFARTGGPINTPPALPISFLVQLFYRYTVTAGIRSRPGGPPPFVSGPPFTMFILPWKEFRSDGSRTGTEA